MVERIPIVFMHIPRTGGVSFVRSLCDNWRNKIAELYPATYEDPEPVRNFLNSDSARSIRLYTGHFPFGIHNWLPSTRCFYISIVREPVARIISLYLHTKFFRSRLRSAMKVKGIWTEDALLELLRPGAFPDFYRDFSHWILGDDTLDSFLNSPSPELDNAMVRRFSGLGVQEGKCPPNALDRSKENIEKSFSMVGITEQYPKTIELFRSVLNLPAMTLRHDNASGTRWSSGSDPNEFQIEALSLARIKELNRLDAELYDWIKKRFVEQVHPACHIPLHVDCRKDASEEFVPLWMSVGTLGLSPIVVGSCARPALYP